MERTCMTDKFCLQIVFIGKTSETHLSLNNAINQGVHVSGIKSMFQRRHFIYTATQGPHIGLGGKNKTISVDRNLKKKCMYFIF